jgi:predicted nucleotide-binding protein (sugar kinase/HSP70/actin superfamily)
LRKEQKAILECAICNREWVFILSGRPYHADPLVQQQAGQILSDMGIHVLTDNVFLGAKTGGGFNRQNAVS